MTFADGQVLSLSALQRGVYEYIASHIARCGRGPEFSDVRAQFSSEKSFYLKVSVQRLTEKRYIRIASDGSMIAMNPPHDRVIREVCSLYGVTLEELRGGARTLRLSRIRRDLSKRLRNGHHYSFPAIAHILNRCRSVIQMYVDPEARTRRNQHRADQERITRAAALEARA